MRLSAESAGVLRAASCYRAGMPTYPRTAPGPFRADQLRDGDEYELSDGHAIRCVPAGIRHGSAHLDGGRVLASDPAVKGRVGIDIGVTWNDDKNLRAPDLIVGDFERGPGWLRKVPPLAVEYADTGQDEADLSAKIAELHAAGTRYIWVVRLTGPLRVDVHTRGEAMRTVGADGELSAPGVLQNSVPVRALVDHDAANAVTLRNLLEAQGHGSIAEIEARGQAKGKAEGIAEGKAAGLTEGEAKGKAEGLARSILTVLGARGIAITEDQADRIHRCRDLDILDRWLRNAVTASTAAELLA